MTGEIDIPISRGTGWLAEELKLERGDKPHHTEICRKLRMKDHPPPPQAVQEYIADLVDGTVKKARGPTPPSPAEHSGNLWRAYLLRKRHQEHMERHKADGVKDASYQALLSISEEIEDLTGTKISEETIRSWMQYGRSASNSPN